MSSEFKPQNSNLELNIFLCIEEICAYQESLSAWERYGRGSTETQRQCIHELTTGFEVCAPAHVLTYSACAILSRSPVLYSCSCEFDPQQAQPRIDPVRDAGPSRDAGHDEPVPARGDGEPFPVKFSQDWSELLRESMKATLFKGDKRKHDGRMLRSMTPCPWARCTKSSTCLKTWRHCTLSTTRLAPLSHCRTVISSSTSSVSRDSTSWAALGWGETSVTPPDSRPGSNLFFIALPWRYHSLPGLKP